MTYHRTGGTGGTRNSPRERHADRFLPNFNKSQGSGAKRKGKRMDNPGKGSKRKDTPKQRYDRMMSGIPPKKTIGEHLGSRMIGKSKVTGRY